MQSLKLNLNLLGKIAKEIMLKKLLTSEGRSACPPPYNNTYTQQHTTQLQANSCT
jgi:hypothetical protein